MRQDFIFAPMGALALLNFLVPILRFRASASGQVKAEDFRFGESAAVPPNVSIPNRNSMKLRLRSRRWRVPKPTVVRPGSA